MFTSTVRKGEKCDPSAKHPSFDCRMIVGARQTLVFVFLLLKLSTVYSVWCSKGRTSSGLQFGGQIMKEVRLGQADRKATVGQIITLYKCSEQKSSSEYIKP